MPTGSVAAVEKMRASGAPEAAQRAFRHYLGRLETGEQGFLADTELAPVADVPALEALEPGDPDALATALDATVVLRLNGGLGTSMGLSGPKSLLEVKDGLSFLDVVARQVLSLRAAHGARLPLVLMNSFATREPSRAALARHPGLPADVPPDFLQHREPKLRADDHAPVAWPDAPALEWCPPGHGDVYTALHASGMLAALRERGYRYLFMANADNLGAVLEPRLLTWFAASGAPFLMEVVEGTQADRKGGHIALRPDGSLVLRETAQVPPGDEASFRDFRRWRFYNTNNLWLRLDALAELLAERDGFLALPLIVNRKTVDPAQPESPPVLQLETAMGSALGVFADARVVAVPRERFAPVKTTDDLLVVRSDAYALREDGRVCLASERHGAIPYVELDPRFYRRLADFEARFPAGPPSLLACERLVVRGDVTFGRDVVVRGAVELDEETLVRGAIADGLVLEGWAAHA